MAQNTPSDLQRLLDERFSDAPTVPEIDASPLIAMAARGSCRAFDETGVPLTLLDTLCAVALASPSKSDLQQRDIVLLTDSDVRANLAALVPAQSWVADAPVIAVFCGNNRRQRQLHEMHNIPFANDHLDAFFNAAVDGAIALGAFVTAAEAVGLGCCPISAVRNDAQAVSDLLALPDHVFPVAGLAIGYPAEVAAISKRLPLSATVHHNQFSEAGIEGVVTPYDAERLATQPYGAQRQTDKFGEADAYGWSTDKVRQYSQPERAEFGAFMRAKGFRFD